MVGTENTPETKKLIKESLSATIKSLFSALFSEWLNSS